MYSRLVVTASAVPSPTNSIAPRRSTSRPTNGETIRIGTPNSANVMPIHVRSPPRPIMYRLQITSQTPPAKKLPKLRTIAARKDAVPERPWRAAALAGGVSVPGSSATVRERGDSWTATVTTIAAITIPMLPTTNTARTSPVSAAAMPPMAGPKMNPAFWAAEYRPKASPRRSGGVASMR